jgi:predicted CoA-binding protein
VNPRLETVEGVPCHASLAAVPGPPRAVSVVAPPAASGAIIADALLAGVKHLWFQPGAEDAVSVEAARKAGIEVIAFGPCLLVVLGFRDV